MIESAMFSDIIKTDLTFFTNEPNSTLLDRFIKILKDVKYFDILVGHFRSSGFFRLYNVSHDNIMENPNEVILSECFVK